MGYILLVPALLGVCPDADERLILVLEAVLVAAPLSAITYFVHRSALTRDDGS
jgi:hypothetical protein